MAYTLENRDILINGWEQGIGDNPYAGIYDMRNIDPTSIQGEVGVAMSTDVTNTQAPITAVAFTVDTGVSTSVFNYNGTTALEVNTAVIFTGADLPNGLTSASLVYYVKTIPTSTSFTVSKTAGGTAETFSDNGSGTMTFSTVNMGRPVYFTMADTIGFYGTDRKFYFMLDSNSRCWVWNSSQLGSTNKWVYLNNKPAESSAYDPAGLIAWKNYLFVFYFSDIWVLYLDNLTLGAPNIAQFTTKANWLEWHEDSDPNTLTTGISHQAIIDSQRDAVYFCNGDAIGTIAEVDGAVFGLSATATVADGVTTDTDATITTVTGFFTSEMVGCEISGTGIPTDARIASVTNNKSAELNIGYEATATASGITFTVTQSYTFTSSAIAIPSNDQTTCLAELNGNILVGGKNNYIYPWDKLSQGYGTPIFLSERYVSRMVTVNTTTYIFCGRKGNIYQTNGSNVALFKSVPIHLSETLNPTIRFLDAIFNRNQLLFGFLVKSNTGTTINEYGGVWAIDLETGALFMPNQMSYATYSGYVSALIAYVGESASNSLTSTTNTFGNTQGYGYFAGWYDGTVYNIDKTVDTPYILGESYVISDMIPVGQFLTKRTFENVEYKLSTPLVSGETVALSYRTNITEAFTDIPITQGGSTGDLSGIGLINFENAQWVQLKATLTSTATTPSYCRLREIRIR